MSRFGVLVLLVVAAAFAQNECASGYLVEYFGSSEAYPSGIFDLKAYRPFPFNGKSSMVLHITRFPGNLRGFYRSLSTVDSGNILPFAEGSNRLDYGNFDSQLTGITDADGWTDVYITFNLYDKDVASRFILSAVFETEDTNGLPHRLWVDGIKASRFLAGDSICETNNGYVLAAQCEDLPQECDGETEVEGRIDSRSGVLITNGLTYVRPYSANRQCSFSFSTKSFSVTRASTNPYVILTSYIGLNNQSTLTVTIGEDTYTMPQSVVFAYDEVEIGDGVEIKVEFSAGTEEGPQTGSGFRFRVVDYGYNSCFLDDDSCKRQDIRACVYSLDASCDGEWDARCALIADVCDAYFQAGKPNTAIAGLPQLHNKPLFSNDDVHEIHDCAQSRGPTMVEACVRRDTSELKKDDPASIAEVEASKVWARANIDPNLAQHIDVSNIPRFNKKETLKVFN